MRNGGLLLAILGVLAIIFAFVAHSVGVGHSGFGIKHVIVLVVGIVLLTAGAAMALRAPRARI